MSKIKDLISSNPEILGNPITNDAIARMRYEQSVTEWWITDEYQQRLKREALQREHHDEDADPLMDSWQDEQREMMHGD